MPSRAFTVFNSYTCKEVASLIAIFRERNLGRGPNVDYGLLYGGLILLTSGWETYCEDVSKEAVGKIVSSDLGNFEDLPQTVQRTILKFSWPEKLDNCDPLETNLAKLPGDGWKNLLLEMVEDYLRDFNTPKFRRPRGKNLKQLFKLYLNADVVVEINRLLGVEHSEDDLDRMTSIRNQIAHKGRPRDADHFDANGLENFLNRVTNLCAAIDCIIWNEFRMEYYLTPWRMTRAVTSQLPGFNQQ